MPQTRVWPTLRASLPSFTLFSIKLRMLFVPHVNEYVATMREINKRAFKTELNYEEH